MTIVKPALLSLLCAVLLMLSHQQTASRIADNQRWYAEQLLRDMVPGAAIEAGEGSWQLYRGDSPAGRITEASTRQGYNGEIRFLLATDESGTVLAVRVTQHRETPGIGDGIDHEVSDWISQFEQRRLAQGGWALKPAGDFDALSGATITSRAMVQAVQEALSK